MCKKKTLHNSDDKRQRLEAQLRAEWLSCMCGDVGPVLSTARQKLGKTKKLSRDQYMFIGRDFFLT